MPSTASLFRNPPWRLAAVLASFLVANLTTANLAAQTNRYELGLRLRDLERRMLPLASADCAAALRELDSAVKAFFAMDLASVARAIDRANAALDGEAPTAVSGYARSLQLATNSRLVDAAAGKLAATLSQVYRSERPPDESPLQLSVRCPGVEPPLAVIAVADLPQQLQLDLQQLPLGDHRLQWSLHSGDLLLAERWQGLSVASDLAARLAALGERTEAKPAPGLELEAATLRWLLQMLRNMQRSQPEETVLPGARLLAEAEALQAALLAGEPYYGPDRSGQFWLQLPIGKSTAQIRIQVPSVTGDERRPLVLALHGAGGSENMFFDGYGDGRIAELAAERGWFVAAPRSGLLGQADLAGLVDALAERYPIDRQQVAVVGHSMGAAQAVQACTANPARFAALAALGGGGNPARNVELGNLPCFVGIGSRDFAYAQAKTLHSRLQAQGAPATLRELPDVEHLAIVQFALPEVFEFFATSFAAR